MVSLPIPPTYDKIRSIHHAPNGRRIYLLKNNKYLKRCSTVNYPETKDFGASWADQSNLQSYLHTL